MLHMLLEDAFHDLLACWREHQRRRALAEVDAVELAESRFRLDRARDRVHRLRYSMYPRVDEAESVAASVYCDSLDAVVHLGWRHTSSTTPGAFFCPCGQPVIAADADAAAVAQSSSWS